MDRALQSGHVQTALYVSSRYGDDGEREIAANFHGTPFQLRIRWPKCHDFVLGRGPRASKEWKAMNNVST